MIQLLAKHPTESFGPLSPAHQQRTKLKATSLSSLATTIGLLTPNLNRDYEGVRSTVLASFLSVGHLYEDKGGDLTR